MNKLNAVNSCKLSADVKLLGKHPYGGHSVLIGKVAAEWQDTEYVLGLFDSK